MALRSDYSEKTVLHKHHIFGGTSLRRISEAEGFFVWLCPQHHVYIHEGTGASRVLQRQAQRKYEETHAREEFMSLLGRSYL